MPKISPRIAVPRTNTKKPVRHLHDQSESYTVCIGAPLSEDPSVGSDRGAGCRSVVSRGRDGDEGGRGDG